MKLTSFHIFSMSIHDDSSHVPGSRSGAAASPTPPRADGPQLEVEMAREVTDQLIQAPMPASTKRGRPRKSPNAETEKRNRQTKSPKAGMRKKTKRAGDTPTQGAKSTNVAQRTPDDTAMPNASAIVQHTRSTEPPATAPVVAAAAENVVLDTRLRMWA